LLERNATVNRNRLIQQIFFTAKRYALQLPCRHLC
jgi:hypothetical protein